MAGMDGALRVLLVIVIGLATPAIAAAQTPEPIPGDSSIDQYIPTIPGAGGDQPLGGGGGGGGGGGSGDGDGSGGSPTKLPPQVTEELQSLDPAGAGLVGFTERTAPARDRAGDRPEDGPGGGLAPSIGEVDAESAAGLGIGLPIILAIALLAALLMVLGRRRGRAAEE